MSLKRSSTPIARTPRHFSTIIVRTAIVICYSLYYILLFLLSPILLHCYCCYHDCYYYHHSTQPLRVMAAGRSHSRVAAHRAAPLDVGQDDAAEGLCEQLLIFGLPKGRQGREGPS